MPPNPPRHPTEILESALLEILLEYHPGQLSLDEIVRELARDPESAAERDDVINAVTALSRAGLVHRSGGFAFASRAAVRLQELLI
jgi:Fe2+ or Zn2+ uptake regulation protein